MNQHIREARKNDEKRKTDMQQRREMEERESILSIISTGARHIGAKVLGTGGATAATSGGGAGEETSRPSSSSTVDSSSQNVVKSPLAGSEVLSPTSSTDRTNSISSHILMEEGDNNS